MTESRARLKKIIVPAFGVIAALVIISAPSFANNDIQQWGIDWFVGTDTYMRMVNVQNWFQGLLQNGAWYDNFTPKTNWPHGDTLHWTRPLDILLAGGALILAPVVGLKSGFYLWAIAISPVLAGVAMVVLFWATRPLLDHRGHAALAVFIALMPITRNYFYAARPDHHSLILLLFASVLALMLRMVMRSKPDVDQLYAPTLAILAGVACGVGLWVSVESLVTLLFALLALGLFWLVQGSNARLNDLRWLLWGLALATTAALMIERPPGEWLSAVEYDRLSIPHWTLAAALALAGEGLWRLSKLAPQLYANWPGRLGLGIATAAVPATLMAVLFVEFYQGPFGAAMDPRLAGLWLGRIQEVQHLFSDDQHATARAVLTLGPLVFMGFWLWLIRAEITPEKRNAIWLLGLGVALLVPLTLYQIRWAAYLGFVLAIPWAALTERLYDWRGGPMVGPAPGTPVFRVPLVAFVFLSPILITSAMVLSMPDDEDAKSASCKWSDLTPVLLQMGEKAGRPLVVMSRIHEGPEMLYRTGYPVIGTPYHRNTDGILDTFYTFADLDLNRARSIVQRRQVDVVAMCRDTAEERAYLKVEGNTLTRLMVDENPPNWMKKVPLPTEIEEKFHLYTVVRQP